MSPSHLLSCTCYRSSFIAAASSFIAAPVLGFLHDFCFSLKLSPVDYILWILILQSCLILFLYSCSLLDLLFGIEVHVLNLPNGVASLLAVIQAHFGHIHVALSFRFSSFEPAGLLMAHSPGNVDSAKQNLTSNCLT